MIFLTLLRESFLLLDINYDRNGRFYFRRVCGISFLQLSQTGVTLYLHGHALRDPRSFQEAAPILNENRRPTRIRIGRGPLIATRSQSVWYTPGEEVLIDKREREYLAYVE